MPTALTLSINQVFVPVLEVPQESPDEAHWWCLALHMKARQLWMIDSMYPDPFATHAKEIDLLVLKLMTFILNTHGIYWDHLVMCNVFVKLQLSGIDVLFRNFRDPAWKAGQLHSWSRRNVEILEPKDK